MASNELVTLRRNDPETTQSSIALAQEDDDALARAMEEHEYLRVVLIGLFGLQMAPHFPQLCRVLSTHRVLEGVAFGDDPRRGLAYRRPAAYFVPFMEAISKNSRLTQVVFMNMRLPGTATVALLAAMPQLTAVILCECDIASRDDAIRITDALSAHPNLCRLTIRPNFSNLGMFPIVQRLAPLLEHRRAPLTLSLSLSTSAGEFNNMVNTGLYLAAAANCHSLHRLCIWEIQNGDAFRAVLRVLPSLQMRHVRLRFQLDFTVEDRVLRLTNALINNYKFLHVDLQTQMEGDDVDIFAELPDQSERLQLCLNRNGQLAEWVANPILVPSYLRNEVLHLAREAGEEELRLSLLVQLGTEAGDRVQNEAVARAGNNRKRKRV